MTRSLRTLAIALLLAIPAFGPAIAGAATACAAGSSDAPHAALVVDTGSRTTTYCVALDAGAVSGLHLIQLAGRQYGLDYSLGFGGQAVCRLDGVGPDGGDCFADYPAFWGYWHGDGAGAWSWAGSGAGSASIGDGDMDGWTWGTGDSGTTHAAPPALALHDVCEPAPSPSPPPGGGGGGGGSGGSSGGSGGGSGGGGSGGASGGANGSGDAGSSAGPDADRSGSSATPTAEPSPPSLTPTPSDDPAIVRASPVSTRASAADSGGPPGGALIALAMVVALGVGGWITLRRRGRRASEER
jgi:hypothetical protein